MKIFLHFPKCRNFLLTSVGCFSWNCYKLSEHFGTTCTESLFIYMKMWFVFALPKKEKKKVLLIRSFHSIIPMVAGRNLSNSVCAPVVFQLHSSAQPCGLIYPGMCIWAPVIHECKYNKYVAGHTLFCWICANIIIGDWIWENPTFCRFHQKWDFVFT